jgi:hypothetical protein
MGDTPHLQILTIADLLEGSALAIRHRNRSMSLSRERPSLKLGTYPSRSNTFRGRLVQHPAVCTLRRLMVRLTSRLEFLTENSGDDSLSMKLLSCALAACSDAVFPSSKKSLFPEGCCESLACPYGKRECLGLTSGGKSNMLLKVWRLLASCCLTLDQQFPKSLVSSRIQNGYEINLSVSGR